MKNKIVLLGSFFLLFVNMVCSQELKITTDKTDAMYEVNTKAVFSISCPKQGDIEYVLTNDGKDELKKGIIPYTDKEINIEGTLGKPGFLLCSVTFTPSDGGEKEKIAAGAAFEPEKIKPAADHMPVDFDEFWQRKKKELSAVPLNAVLTPEKTEEPAIVMYDLKVDCLGPNPVRGYYAKPRNAEKGKCPAIAIFQGAGVYSARKDRIREFAKMGFIAFENNAHGILNGQPKKYYEDLDKTTLNRYKYIDRDDPDKAYMMFMFMRVYRALEFIKTQPEWDGRNLVSYGSSQGGGQAIAAAGLDSDVSFLFAAVPGMCDHGGYINGWPKIIPVQDGVYDQKILKAVKYLDCVNFAFKTKSPALFTIGFIDQICRPTSIYAMYNTYKGPKEIIHAPLMGHKVLDEHKEIAVKRILENLKKEK